MESERKTRLEASGINIYEALERFMGNEKMLEKYLGRFLEDKSYAALVAAVAADDQAQAQAAVHTLKSVCGTIGLTGMREQVLAQEAAMRSGDWARAKAMMPEIVSEYERICAVLRA